MELTFALFATLPLGLLSLFSRMRGTHAGFGFLAALAPVIASGVSSLFKRKGEQSRQQAEIDYRRQQAEQEEAQRRAQFEAFQQSPQAAMQRLGFNTRLAALLGGFGGRAQTPQFIQSAFDLARAVPEYTAGAQFIAPPKVGGGFWDYAGDVAQAASYFDVDRYNRAKQGGGYGWGYPSYTQQAPMTMPSGAGSAIDPNVMAQASPGGGGFQQGLTRLLPSAIRGQQFQGISRPQFQPFSTPSLERSFTAPNLQQGQGLPPEIERRLRGAPPEVQGAVRYGR